MSVPYRVKNPNSGTRTHSTAYVRWSLAISTAGADGSLAACRNSWRMPSGRRSPTLTPSALTIDALATLAYRRTPCSLMRRTGLGFWSGKRLIRSTCSSSRAVSRETPFRRRAVTARLWTFRSTGTLRRSSRRRIPSRDLFELWDRERARAQVLQGVRHAARGGLSELRRRQRPRCEVLRGMWHEPGGVGFGGDRRARGARLRSCRGGGGPARTRGRAPPRLGPFRRPRRLHDPGRRP